ncbi:alanine--glyoxylate aminotransferase family protein [Cognatishimia sp.]|uniref:pyridoxal-phosphate-dependent aminotransferase family protein n=1 Tax=Cognatishimia sp. TaxID=2211648 RepID=UPI00351218B8
MSLSEGRPYLAIPGPSVMPDRVLQAMHCGAPNIYAGEIVTMTESIAKDLKRVAGTEHHVAMYIANGHGVWEAALRNILSPGDTVLVPSVGQFGKGWANMARSIGVTVDYMDFPHLQPMDMDQIKAKLQADTDHKIKAVLVTHVDTSSSIKTDPRVLRGILDDCGHPALLGVDCIASMGCDRFEMDAMGVDMAISASQKGLMVPPGVGFVFFNDRAAAVRATVEAVSEYWDWTPRATPDAYYKYFNGTAPTHHLFGLREALDMIFEEGLEANWRRHEILARAIWAAVEVWGSEGPMQLNVRDQTNRSHAVTSAHLGAPAAVDLRNWLEQKAGVTLGIGLGMSTQEDPKGEGFFRFGHMGHMNAHMVLGMLGTVEAAMIALNIPHGKGALSAAAQVVAEGA